MSSSLSSQINKYFEIGASLDGKNDKELINCFNNQEKCREKWEKAEMELKDSREKDGPLKEEIKSLTVQLELARDQLDSALRKRPAYEKRIKFLEQNLHAVKSLLGVSNIEGVDNDAILKMNDITISDLPADEIEKPVKLGRKSFIPSDCDDSEEETIHLHLVRAASVKIDPAKRKFPVNEVPTKKPSLDTIASMDVKDGLVSPEKQDPNKDESRQLPRPFTKPIETNTIPPTVETKIMETLPPVVSTNVPDLNHRAGPEPSAPVWDQHPCFKGPGLYPQINVEKESTPVGAAIITTKPHNLIQKKEIKPGKCTVCRKGIGFQKLFLRCQDCNIKVHEDCKDLIVSACSTDSTKPKLEDCVSSGAVLKIPQFILDCVREIEKRGLNHEGLYRVSGSLKDVKELKAKLKTSSDVNLANIKDVYTLTSLLKTYLKGMSETLLTRQLHAAFLEAGEKNDLPRIYKLIDSLPVANRHTLAFLLVHLRKVARVQQNLMDVKGLSKVLGPTIIGNGCLNPTNSRLYEEARLQPIILEVLLGLSDDYCAILLGNPEFLNPSKSVTKPAHIEKIPQKAPATDSPLLGPINPNNESKRLPPLATPYSAKKKLFQKLGKNKYFDSPVGKS